MLGMMTLYFIYILISGSIILLKNITGEVNCVKPNVLSSVSSLYLCMFLSLNGIAYNDIQFLYGLPLNDYASDY